ncbi:hypothetical protein V2J09_005560, partial [Rumex salicifolius]
GLYHTPTHNDFKYFVAIVDDFSRNTWTYLINVKSKALHNHTQGHSHCNANDLGKSLEATMFYTSKGIIHQTTSPQQNGVVERKHKHLPETSRDLLFQSRLHVAYRGECVLMATYLINKFSSRILDGKAPYSILFSKPPSYSHIKTFGCLCYVKLPGKPCDKLQPRSITCIFLGFPHGQKAYKVMDIATKRIFSSMNVIFYETSFLFHPSFTLPTQCVLLSIPDVPFPQPISQLETPTPEPNPNPHPRHSQSTLSPI